MTTEPRAIGTQATDGHADRATAEGVDTPPRGRVPDFFIIGHEKCGTTALYNILKGHPQVFMPALKEPRFFITDRPARRPGRGHTVRPQTLEDYLLLFAGARADQRAGEASPQYIRSKDAARRIAEVQPAARVIAILREPTSFLRSYHLQCVRGLIESERDLRKALALEEQRRQGKKIPRKSRAPNRLFYCEHVRYVEQLQRFEAVFGREQMLVLIYEDFLRDNDASARTVLRFLGVDDTVALVAAKGDVHRGVRRRKTVRLQRLHRAALALQRARRKSVEAGRLSRTVDALTPSWLRSDAIDELARRTIFTAPPPPDEQLVRELRIRFKPEVVALSDYLGRDMVSAWGYDRVDGS